MLNLMNLHHFLNPPHLAMATRTGWLDGCNRLINKEIKTIKGSVCALAQSLLFPCQRRPVRPGSAMTGPGAVRLLTPASACAARCPYRDKTHNKD